MNSETLLLQPRDIRSSCGEVEVIGVFNPAVAIVEDEVYMLARVAERPAEGHTGWTPLPRWSLTATTEVDWIRNDDLIQVDARVVALRNNGNLRLTSVSHLQLFRQSRLVPKSESATQAAGSLTRSTTEAWEFVASIFPEGRWEEYGIEDPRVTKIDGIYWITYVAVSRSGAATALMSSTDLITFHRHGILFPSENKDVVLFPALIADDFVALHRPNPHSHFSPPQIWLARSPDMIHWGRHEFVLGGVQPWEGDRVGSGTPPILCEEGWLTLYHGSTRSSTSGTVGHYCAGALLLDRDQPNRVLARSTEPLMQPTAHFETSGFVPNVVFPTSLLCRDDELQVFYGAADTCVASTQLSKQSVLNSLTRPNQGKRKP